MLAGSCVHHADRAAVGVCVSCRKAICIECSTPMAGIHRCASCLRGMEEELSSGRRVSAAHPLVWTLVLLGLVISTLGWAGLAVVLE